jgi:hypothetical protein
MRFALIATSVAAALLSPVVADVAGPQMTGDQFIAEVRCTAYQQVAHPNLELGAERMRLNAEARRQPVETAVAARAEARSVSREASAIANSDEASMMRAERNAACAGATLASGQIADAV